METCWQCLPPPPLPLGSDRVLKLRLYAGRAIPLLGGIVGGSFDAHATAAIAKVARRTFKVLAVMVDAMPPRPGAVGPLVKSCGIGDSTGSRSGHGCGEPLPPPATLRLPSAFADIDECGDSKNDGGDSGGGGGSDSMGFFA